MLLKMAAQTSEQDHSMDDEERDWNAFKLLAVPTDDSSEIASRSSNVSSATAASAEGAAAASSSHEHHAERSTMLSRFLATPLGLTAAQFQVIRAWRRESDFHNNYGSDFIRTELLSDDYQKCINHLAKSSGDDMQSGTAAENQTCANIAWEDAVQTCKELFKMNLTACAAHASDLLQYILTAHSMSHNLELVGPTMIVSFPWHYYTMGFTAHTLALTRSVTFSFRAIETDATEQLQQDKLERKALRELEELFRKHRCICLIEPVCIPGNGRFFRKEFLQQVQELCDRLNVPLVADETLTAVRCGKSLLSPSRGLNPSFVMVGKMFGCALLLSKKDTKNELSTSLSILAPAYTIVHMAFVLRFILEERVAAQCNKQGALLVNILKDVVGEGNVRHVGLAIWVTKDMYRLPISSCVNGRLLPRFDQTAEQLKALLKNQTAKMDQVLAMGPAGRREGNLFNCAVCSISESSNLKECKRCLRVYHARCKPEKCYCFQVRALESLPPNS
jgi:hypothetical protein